jgi:hypothetical protein
MKILLSILTLAFSISAFAAADKPTASMDGKASEMTEDMKMKDMKDKDMKDKDMKDMKK